MFGGTRAKYVIAPEGWKYFLRDESFTSNVQQKIIMTGPQFFEIKFAKLFFPSNLKLYLLGGFNSHAVRKASAGRSSILMVFYEHKSQFFDKHHTRSRLHICGKRFSAGWHIIVRTKYRFNRKKKHFQQFLCEPNEI